MSKLSTDSYKGVRDFYPEDMAVQRYIFDVWSQTAESFGYERYDASVLEPAELYKSKGAENEELVNEQTYTFTDRGDREVTLRPEMTPTVARMIAKKAKELAFPVRWYSIPNLFRYERAQKGRLREHWQLNCDVFGTNDYTADVEVIALAYQVFLNFGADPEMFSVRVNDRAEMIEKYTAIGITDPKQHTAINRLNDRFYKLSESDYRTALKEIITDENQVERVYALISSTGDEDTNRVVDGLRALGIENVVLDRSIARGFDYYTGTIFEFVDTSGENNRSLLGGGRYDNLTGLFGDEVIPGIGFGFGDVTMRDFLETHNLLTADITAPDLLIIPTDPEHNLAAQQVAQEFRSAGINTAVDLSSKKLGKQLASAAERLVAYVLIFGADEITNNTFTIKNLAEETELSGDIETLTSILV